MWIITYFFSSKHSNPVDSMTLIHIGNLDSISSSNPKLILIPLFGYHIQYGCSILDVNFAKIVLTSKNKIRFLTKQLKMLPDKIVHVLNSWSSIFKHHIFSEISFFFVKKCYFAIFRPKYPHINGTIHCKCSCATHGCMEPECVVWSEPYTGHIKFYFPVYELKNKITL